MNRAPQRPTIIDVARAAGVSKSTVSRVLAAPDNAPAETRARVLRAQRRLGYQPSSAARELRGARSPMVALMVGDISQPYHGGFAKGIGRAAHRRGYGVMLLDLDHDPDRLVEYLTALRVRSVLGAVIATADNIDTPEVRARIDELRDSGTVVVTASQVLPYSGVPSVLVDHADNAYRATTYLHDKGCRRVALVGSGDASPHTQALTRGFLDALSTNEQELTAHDLVLGGSYEAASSKEQVTAALARGDRPDGYVAASVYTVFGVRDALQRHGLGDTPIVCCEDVPLLDYLTPPIDSFGIDFDRYADVVLSALDQDEGEDRDQLIHTTLRKRH